MATDAGSEAALDAVHVGDQVINRLVMMAGDIASRALIAINARHAWFAELNAEHRSWIALVARTGIDGFVTWLRDGPEASPPGHIFSVAPSTLMRHITLHQTVDLVRATIDTAEREIAASMPPEDRDTLRMALLQYSREVAFAAAEVYAYAAEERGAWDARLEALVVDAAIRGDADESELSRASTLGWADPAGIVVVVGDSPVDAQVSIEAMRRAATREGVGVLASPRGARLVVVLGLAENSDDAARRIVGELATFFGPGPVVIGSVVDRLNEAVLSARTALAGIRAVAAWPEAPRPVTAAELLPERALSGDGHARRTLSHDVYGALVEAGNDLLATLVVFQDHGGSIESTARALFVHANTVRYRLKRVAEVSGFSPTDPRGAYVLRLAVTLGRLLR